MMAVRQAVPVAPRRQRGISMAEVLVAMVIGLMILGSIGYLFVGSKRTSATQSELQRMQETARNSMTLMGRALRQAGYKLDVESGFNGAALAGTNGAKDADGLSLPDTLTVEHDPLQGGATSLSGSEVNCEGQTVTANGSVDPTTGARIKNTQIVSYRFFILNDALRCSAGDPANPNGIVVAENVENLQVRYGIGANEVLTKYTSTPSTDEFKRAAAVRISILVRGSTPGQVVGTNTLNFDGESLSFDDGYLRRVFTSTFTVRNQTR